MIADDDCDTDPDSCDDDGGGGGGDGGGDNGGDDGGGANGGDDGDGWGDDGGSDDGSDDGADCCQNKQVATDDDLAAIDDALARVKDTPACQYVANVVNTLANSEPPRIYSYNEADGKVAASSKLRRNGQIVPNSVNWPGTGIYINHAYPDYQDPTQLTRILIHEAAHISFGKTDQGADEQFVLNQEDQCLATP